MPDRFAKLKLVQLSEMNPHERRLKSSAISFACLLQVLRSASLVSHVFRTELFLHVSGLQEAANDMKTFMCERENAAKENLKDASGPEKPKSGRKKRRRTRQASRRSTVVPRKLFHDDPKPDNAEQNSQTECKSGDEEPQDEDLHEDGEEDDQEQDESEHQSEALSEDGDVFSRRWKLKTPPPKSQSSRASPPVPKKTPPSQKTASPDDDAPSSVKAGVQDAAGMVQNVDKRLLDVLPHRIAVCLAFHDACSLCLLQLFIHAESEEVLSTSEV